MALDTNDRVPRTWTALLNLERLSVARIPMLGWQTTCPMRGRCGITTSPSTKGSNLKPKRYEVSSSDTRGSYKPRFAG